MTTNKENIDHLITRYLSGEASIEEKQRLEDWRDQSELNKKYFDGFRFVLDKAASSNHLIKVDVDKAWNILNDQLNSGAAHLTIPIVRVPLYQSGWFRVAALFIVIVGISLWMYIHFQSVRINELKSTMQVTQNNTSEFILKDSSSVVLNLKSKITWSKHFGEITREVNLNGEAYFRVKHEPEKQFVVKAEATRVKDIGTSFNIQAYSERSTIEVYVESGEVKFYTENDPGIIVIKGETGIYDKKNKTFSKYKAPDANVIAWQSKVFEFRDTKLIDAVEQLNLVYRANIRLSSIKLNNCKITVNFDKENILSIINIIAETLKLQVIKTSDGYLLKGNGCNE